MGDQIRSVVVLTALEIEREAMVAELVEVSDTERDGTVYYVGKLPCAAELKVAVAEIGPGNVVAAIHVERAKHVLQPDLVAFVGIAGGFKDVEHGDVVIARKVYGYEPGKAEDGEFLTRPDAFPLSHRIEQKARQLIGSGAWKARLAKTPEAIDPKAHLGPIAAGEPVVRSTKSEIAKRIKRNFNDTIAVEMEGRGLLLTAHMNDSMPAVVVRGISDLIDDKDDENDERWQPIAARHAAAYAAELFCLLAGSPNPIELGSKGALAAITQNLSNAYYINLDRLFSDPSALAVFDGWVRDALRDVHSWRELGFMESSELRDAGRRAIEGWSGAALPLSLALTEEEVGSRVVFDGDFRTRNADKYDPAVGLVGDLELDPFVYTDVAGRRVRMSIDPRWATTSTGRGAFRKGQIRLSGVALLRAVDSESALASPFVLAPPAQSRHLDRMMFGGD
jgi:nucleoside phosphorylase